MRLSAKKIAITGENGFVGRHLVRALKSLDLPVIPLRDINGKRVDIRRIERFQSDDDIDILYHLAAVTSNSSYIYPHNVYETNVLGTLNVLEFCRLADIKKVVYASSYVYGDPEYLPVDEKHTASPNNPYSRSKLMGEELCQSYQSDFGIECIVLRPFNIYGAGQKPEFLIPKIISGLSDKQIVLQDPEPKRDFLYIADMIDAYIKAGEYDSNFEVFNIGYGKSYSVSEIAEKLLRMSGSQAKVSYKKERRRNEIMDCYANIEKARSVLGWQPQVSLDEGLRRTLANSLI